MKLLTRVLLIYAALATLMLVYTKKAVRNNNRRAFLYGCLVSEIGNFPRLDPGVLGAECQILWLAVNRKGDK